MATVVADNRGTARPRFRLPGMKNGKLASLAFLAPAAIWLLALVIYPIVATARYSVLNEDATRWVGLNNYKAIFSTDAILTTFRNNAIWVIVFPFTVTVIGLIMAVLTERIRWSTAFKAVIVMPVVFSATTSALVFRTLFDISPNVGVVNAVIQTVGDWVRSPGAYPTSATGQPVSALVASGVKVKDGGLISTSTVHSGQSIHLGIIGISPQTLALLHARPAAAPPARAGSVTGVVWRDFSPSHPLARGRIFPDEDGLPDLHVSLVSASGASVSSATTNSSGQFTLATSKGGGPYRVSIDSSNFRSPVSGPVWLGTNSITPTSGLSSTAQALFSVPLIDLSMILAYLWIWSGFAMIIIGAGLASLNPEVLEAARTEGAREWQVFRRITVPMLAPVLIVVFVTMVINVLKVFDIILNMAPGSSQAGASTLALEMYNQGFSGGIHSGLSSAIAVILFLLVVPAMLLQPQKAARMTTVDASVVQAAPEEHPVAAVGRRWRPSRLVLNIALAAIALLWLVPTISLAIISLRPEALFETSGWWKVFSAPSQLTFHNYSTLLVDGLAAGGVLSSLLTSLEITVPVALLVTVISSMAAYSLVFGNWPGRDAVFLFIVALIVVPLQVALIPTVELYHTIGNITGYNPFGKIVGVVIFHVAFGLPFGIFLMRNFYLGIPRDLIEAGRIDGAREGKLFRRVVLPLGLPAAAALTVFQFVWVWNDLLVALIFLGGNAHVPLTVFLFDQTRSLAADYWIIATGGIISILIPVAVFFAFQKHFVRGMLAGSVK